MSGHTFFGERWYGFDDGLYAGARLLEILSRHADPSAVLDALPDARVHARAQHRVRRRRAARADRAAAQTATFPGATEVIRIDGLRVEYAGRLRPRARVEHDAGDRAALRGRRRRARSRASRTSSGACCARRSPASRCRSDDADVTRSLPRAPPWRPMLHVTLADVVAARERIAGGIYESPCVESIPLSQLTGAHIFCKLDYLQRTGSFKERGARNALLHAARRAAQARRDRRVGRQSRAGRRLSRQPARHSGDGRDAEVRARWSR